MLRTKMNSELRVKLLVYWTFCHLVASTTARIFPSDAAQKVNWDRLRSLGIPSNVLSDLLENAEPRPDDDDVFTDLLNGNEGGGIPLVERMMMFRNGGLFFPEEEIYPMEMHHALNGKFPKLTTAQRKFGTNPGYMSFYDPSLKSLEDEQEEEEEKISRSDELSLSALEAPNQASRDADGMYNKLSSREVQEQKLNDIYFTVIVAVSSALVAFGIVCAGFCYHRLQRNAKAAEGVEYPAYGVTGPGKNTLLTSGASGVTGGDRKLAQNAQMYHYQHQKQQIIAFDKSNREGSITSSQNRRSAATGSVSDDDSDYEGEEADYTVYECPGLASTGEMEVRNPMFEDDLTPKATATASSPLPSSSSSPSSSKK